MAQLVVSLTDPSYMDNSDAGGLYDSGLTSLTPFTVTLLFRKNYAGGIDMLRFSVGNYPRTLDISLINSSEVRVVFFNHGRDFNGGYTSNQWVVLSAIYAGGGSFSGSNLIVRVNGVQQTDSGGVWGSNFGNNKLENDSLKVQITLFFN